MSEEILYIVSDYVQWHEPVDLASTREQFKMLFSCVYFRIFIYRRKHLGNDLNMLSTTLGYKNISHIYHLEIMFQMNLFGSLVLEAMVKFYQSFNKVLWKCVQKSIITRLWQKQHVRLNIFRIEVFSLISISHMGNEPAYWILDL